jgi:hypothetical protein
MVKRMISNKNLNKQHVIYVLLGIWIAFLFFNFYMPTVRADDLFYAKRLSQFGYLGASADHYKTWSSRIIIELFLMFFSNHFALWKIINSFVMLGTVLLLCLYIFDKIRVNHLLIVFAVYCFTPLTIMGETGWIATTLNYHWPVTFSLWAFLPFYQRLKDRPINVKSYRLIIPLLIFAANQEQVNACYFVLTGLLSIVLWVQGRYNVKLMILSIISFIEILITLIAPGNAARSISETTRWFPQYKDFNLINKLDLGISSFGKVFFLDTNLIFLFLFALVFFLSYKKYQRYSLKVAAGIPLFLNLIIYIGNTMQRSYTNIGEKSSRRAMIWSSSNLNEVFSKMGTKLSLTHPETWVPTLLIVALLACFIIGLYGSFASSRQGKFAVLLLLMGFCSRVLMGFSPTVWASGLRTYYIIYIVVVILILLLLKELFKEIDQKQVEHVQFVLIVVAICTFTLMILNRG